MEETNDTSIPSTVALKQLSEMISIALDDNILTTDEKKLLYGMAESLGIEKSEMEAILNAKLKDKSISQPGTEIAQLDKPRKQPLAKRFSSSIGNVVSRQVGLANKSFSKVKQFGLDKCATITGQTKGLEGFVSSMVSLIKENSHIADQQQAHVRIQLDALLTKIRARQEQSKIAKENKKREFEMHSVRFDAITHQISDIEHARKKRRSLLKNPKDSSVAENESKNIEIEEAVLSSLKTEILAIPITHAKRLKISKTIKRIDYLAHTTIFDETEEEKTERFLNAAGKFTGEAFRGLGGAATELAKSEAFQKIAVEKGVEAWENRKKKS